MGGPQEKRNGKKNKRDALDRMNQGEQKEESQIKESRCFFGDIENQGYTEEEAEKDQQGPGFRGAKINFICFFIHPEESR